MNMTSRIILIPAAALAAILFSSCQTTQTTGTPVPGTFQRTGEIHLAVSTTKTSYQVGDLLSFTVVPSEDAYLAAWVRGSDGAINQIYPNAHSSRKVFRGGVPARLPASGDFQFRVSPPTGRDTLIVIASTVPVNESTPPAAGAWMKGASVEPASVERRGEARLVYGVTE